MSFDSSALYGSVLNHSNLVRGFMDVNDTNSTMPVSTPPACRWATLYIEGAGCVPYLDLSPGWRFTWTVYTTLFPILFFIMAIVYAHDFTRYYYGWKTKKKNAAGARPRHIAMNAMTYVFSGGAIGALLMGIASIDGWGLFLRFKVSTYLGIYAPAYGLIGTFTVILTGISLLDDLVISAATKKITTDHRYSIGSLIFMILAVLYGSVGYVIYGWILAVDIGRNPDSKLGSVGDHLVEASLGLEILTLLTCVIPVIVSINGRIPMMNSTASRVELKRMSRKLQTWVMRQLMANIFLISYMVANNVKNKNGGLEATFNVLTWCRLVEIFKLINTHDLLKAGSSAYVERVPFQVWFTMIAGKCGFAWEDEEDDFYSSPSVRSRAGTNSSSGGAQLSSRGGGNDDIVVTKSWSRTAKNPKNVQEDTSDDESDDEDDYDVDTSPRHKTFGVDMSRLDGVAPKSKKSHRKTSEVVDEEAGVAIATPESNTPRRTKMDRRRHAEQALPPAIAADSQTE